MKKSPHGKAVPLVTLQVSKLGPWEGTGPYALMIETYQGGGYSIAQGTKKRMNELARIVKERLKLAWGPAKCVVDIALPVIPENDRPAK